MSSDYRFLNPYNFVRYLPPGKKNGEQDIKLLGRCTPPPHDRFIGLTGIIECELEAATPIFISDSEFVEEKGNEHKSYRFFRLRNEDGEEEFAIPSTSLRGMLRSVFEAATNSCFSVFEGEKRLSYREVQKARAMKPAIVRSLPGDNSLGRIEICESARVPFNLLKEDNWKCGEDAYAIFSIGKVNQISKNPLNGGKKGWVKITGKNIPNKRNEYFFYPTNNQLNFDKDRMRDYNKVLQEQIANGFSTEYQTPTLEVGNLVYAEVSQNEVVNIALVKVPRLLYRNSIGELLPTYLYPCLDYNNLCPACRVFGWVNPNPPEDRKEKVAYAGRVKISHAKIINNNGILPEFPLAILSTPKPTTTFFYLLKNRLPDSEVTYDTDGAQLRGRKFYRHQEKAEEQEYKRTDNKKDHQNCTIRDALKPCAKFSFTIEFETLSPVELGVLLWSIEIEKGMHHKLGLAKPLGFGSVNFSVKNITILDIKERYKSFTNGGWRTINDQKKMEWLTLFKETMRNKYNKPFEQLENIKDLKAIFRVPPSALPTHYPRTLEKPDVSGRNFEWFMRHKRGEKMHLEIASEDTNGFPLLVKSARRKKKEY